APGLPRMDVAAFAGFAASGPVGIPVAVEDVVRFGEIFGGELALAWDAARGETTYAHLAPAVREFFRNGGRRCWVLRLAERAESARFLLPGLLRGREGKIDGAAWATASSPGSWADAVSVNATTLRKSLVGGAVERTGSGFRLTRPVTPDLLRVDYPESGTVAFFPPPPSSGDADRTRAEREAELRRVATSGYWFRSLLPGAFPADAPSALAFLSMDGARTVTPLAWEVEAGEVRVSLDAADAEGIRAGCWLRADIVAPPIPFLRDVFLLVDEERRGGESHTFVARRAWRMLEPAPAWGTVDGEAWVASLAAAELWARRTSESLLRVADVGLVPGHPRYFGFFPADALLYEPAEEVARDAAGPVLSRDLERGVAGPLWAELGRPRFPLAAPVETAGDVFLPLGLLALPREEAYQPAVVSTRTALERDGLAEFGAELFLDDALAGEGAETLLDTAFFRQYQVEPPARPIRLHALLGIDEASIIAVPDAVHAGWRWREGSEHAPPAVPAAPVIVTVTGPDEEGVMDVAWTASPGATGYTLEDSPDPRFRRDVRSTSTEVTTARLLRPAACPATLYLRVRALAEAGRSPWSATWRQGIDDDRFRACERFPLPAPVLSIAEEEGRLVLTWIGAGEAFVLETSAEPSFGAPTVLHSGPAREYDLWATAGAAWFRVAARLGDEESPWSTTVAHAPAPDSRWETLGRDDLLPASSPPRTAAELLPDLHTAMLRFCAARSDIFAVLSLPVWMREEEALAHAAGLADVLGAGAAEPGDQAARTLSFGALYHPWTVVRSPAAGAPTRSIPPDGAACGVIAARSIAMGAWAAPANQPLAGVAALEPKLSAGARAAFLGRRVNALAPFPRGFMAWSEETLSDDPELVGIGVRRLLILLRRLALREGNTYVFQPNDRAFRRLVQRQFDQLLGEMFTRGAFAGASAAEGFRVVTDDTVNTDQGVDQGRFVVELRVAPSRPLAFLTVRLVQTGAGVTVQER
ncbi:MAG TPA: hypothetical protein VFQ39_17025, partial [Longimicrobium sp.]|nr:hypothetical protein [Longimicrobium sp.]